MWASTEKQSYLHIMKYLLFCGREGIVFNSRKMQIGQTELEIFGFQMTQSRIMPSKNQLESIRRFPTPKSLRNIRAFMGLINQASWCESQDTRVTIATLRDKLKTRNEWIWSDEHSKNFLKLKESVNTILETGNKVYFTKPNTKG